MKNYTFWDKIKDKLYYTPLGNIEWYFAKKWLDNTFGHIVGKQEYWGDYLMELITKIKEKK